MRERERRRTRGDSRFIDPGLMFSGVEGIREAINPKGLCFFGPVTLRAGLRLPGFTALRCNPWICHSPLCGDTIFMFSTY